MERTDLFSSFGTIPGYLIFYTIIFTAIAFVGIFGNTAVSILINIININIFNLNLPIKFLGNLDIFER